jgi:putative hydrolase of the HAD superfamily
MTNIRAVFFDAVGTLIYPEPPAPKVYYCAAQRLGSHYDQRTIASRFVIALHRQEQLDFAAGQRTDEARERARWRAIVAEVLDDVTDPEGCFQELYEHFASPAAWRCTPGTAKVLAVLADRGYTLGMASNFDHRLHCVAEGLVELRPMHHIVISSEVGWRKPAAPFFQAVCSAVSLKPEQVLFVGDDAVNDLGGAHAAGLPALLLEPGAVSLVDVANRLPPRCRS